MKLGVLFTGGKDSTYAAWLVKKQGHELKCLITIYSKNPDSFMFHTPAIEMTKKQAKLIGIPIIIKITKGEKELELRDLKIAIEKAKTKYSIEGIVTGALASDYQASRILKICKEIGLKCINPLWHKNQIELLKGLVKNNFRAVISGVAAYPLDRTWIGKEIEKRLIIELENLAEKYKINPAGEGGEFESLVVACPLFKENLRYKITKIIGGGNSWRGIFK